MIRSHRYSEYSHRIDVDAFEEAINFDFLEEDGKGNDVGYCPDPWGMHKHGDTTGKFAIHREKKVFNCWVCGGGTLLSLAMAIWDICEDDAIDRLLAFCAEPSDERYEEEITDLMRDEKAREPVRPWFNVNVLDKFDQSLGADDPIWEWLEDRHIDDQVAANHRVGYDPQAVKLSKKGRYEGPGIIFPHFWQGHLVGWQTRWLEPDDERPPWVQKYNNTRDFPKAWTIYNYEGVYLSPDPIVVVESVPTALFLESLEYPAIAMFGATAPDEQLHLLRSCQQGLILAPDNDPPGIKFVKRATEYLERYVDIKVCLPVGEEGSGSDLADLEDTNEVREVISDAVDLSLL